MSLILWHLRRLGFKKISPNLRVVTKDPIRLQVAPVSFLKNPAMRVTLYQKSSPTDILYRPGTFCSKKNHGTYPLPFVSSLLLPPAPCCRPRMSAASAGDVPHGLKDPRVASAVMLYHVLRAPPPPCASPVLCLHPTAAMSTASYVVRKQLRKMVVKPSSSDEVLNGAKGTWNDLALFNQPNVKSD
jgi:hypothetical protein